ncbi:MAG: bifunctional demethylmenaquinone methyltransferase/2-methoxy-6-polyprenyl-1,4-benzoquinol methylase UbiE [Tannerella sp.]|jgi:demethylmenaquinone methyltransferase/2-methoxy-6-polyprenyl-1,4-benzoquinol methylase|nr:bifunctional demethylmenaquinone methyltransferase/2-methoxy-6-polyprenyl-1,4-benzoquinol methylase UbiE [Tannerella sp.]
MITAENVLPYSGTEKKGLQIKRMFDTIAGRYDRMNHVLSLGFDRSWRRKTVHFLRPYHPKTILDVASGTGDLALLMCRQLQPEKVIGADLSEGMMAIGAAKAAEAGFGNMVSFEYQDCMSLSYSDASFDAVTAAFGVRNFAHIEQGLAEMYRVLKQEGHIAILELSTPDYFPMKQLYHLYSKLIVSFLGGLFGLEKAAYNYLPASIEGMPQGARMKELLSMQGFIETRIKRFTLGVCTLYTAKK